MHLDFDDSTEYSLAQIFFTTMSSLLRSPSKAFFMSVFFFLSLVLGSFLEHLSLLSYSLLYPVAPHHVVLVLLNSLPDHSNISTMLVLMIVLSL